MCCPVARDTTRARDVNLVISSSRRRPNCLPPPHSLKGKGTEGNDLLWADPSALLGARNYSRLISSEHIHTLSDLSGIGSLGETAIRPGPGLTVADEMIVDHLHCVRCGDTGEVGTRHSCQVTLSPPLSSLPAGLIRKARRANFKLNIFKPLAGKGDDRHPRRSQHHLA